MKLLIGDIFEFRVNENNLAFGQIVNFPNNESLAIVIFKGLYLRRPLKKELIEDEILFFGITFDAKLYHKHWQIIGNDPTNLNDFELPFYKIGTGKVFVEDFYGNRIRKASKEEEEILIHKSYVAPVRFELALKAYYKSLEWKDEYNELLYSKAYDLEPNDPLIIKFYCEFLESVGNSKKAEELKKLNKNLYSN